MNAKMRHPVSADTFCDVIFSQRWGGDIFALAAEVSSVPRATLEDLEAQIAELGINKYTPLATDLLGTQATAARAQAAVQSQQKVAQQSTTSGTATDEEDEEQDDGSGSDDDYEYQS
jgi:hypothetical protein